MARRKVGTGSINVTPEKKTSSSPLPLLRSFGHSSLSFRSVTAVEVYSFNRLLSSLEKEKQVPASVLFLLFDTLISLSAASQAAFWHLTTACS